MKATKKGRRAASQLWRLCLVDGRLDEGRVRQVAQQIASSGRRGALPILTHFQRLVRLECGRHAALVQSAVPLPANVRATVQAELTRLYGPGMDATFEENPALIGGMRIQVGSDVYDGSLRTRLAALEAHL